MEVLGNLYHKVVQNCWAITSTIPVTVCLNTKYFDTNRVFKDILVMVLHTMI